RHLPRLPRIDGDVAVEPPCQDDALAERIAKPGRQREPALLVDRVLEGADEHRPRRWSIRSPISTLPHFTPLSPTVKPHEGRIIHRGAIPTGGGPGQSPRARSADGDVPRRDAPPRQRRRAAA